MANTDSKPILPVSLIVEDRSCLVVGGGKIAGRKIQYLIDSGAAITVVATKVTKQISEYAAQGRIDLHLRPFKKQDIKNYFLVYAATDNPELNREIIGLCKENGILVCAIDAAWRESDFLTPATIRHKGLTVSVATGGKSCRRSRLIKEALGQHIRYLDNSDLFIIGVSHEQLDTVYRQKLHIINDHFDLVGGMIARVAGLYEFVLINTCNRIEVHGIGAISDYSRMLLLKILGFDALQPTSFYVKTGFDAFSHSVALAAGLLSQLTGEYHIVSQLKLAYETAGAKSWSAGIMKEWLSASLHLSKKVRNSTSQQINSIDIDDIIIQYLKKQCDTTIHKRLLLLGTGQIGTALFRKIMESVPFADIDWLYRTKAPELLQNTARTVHINSLHVLHEKLKVADVVISALSSNEFVIKTADCGLIKPEAVLIDVGMPPTIDPGITIARDKKTQDLDTLKQWYNSRNADIPKLLSACRATVLHKRELYDKLVNSIKDRDSDE